MKPNDKLATRRLLNKAIEEQMSVELGYPVRAMMAARRGDAKSQKLFDDIALQATRNIVLLKSRVNDINKES